MSHSKRVELYNKHRRRWGFVSHKGHTHERKRLHKKKRRY